MLIKMIKNLKIIVVFDFLPNVIFVVNLMKDVRKCFQNQELILLKNLCHFGYLRIKNCSENEKQNQYSNVQKLYSS